MVFAQNASMSQAQATQLGKRFKHAYAMSRPSQFFAYFLKIFLSIVST